jgi:PAS domain S-box-containing protein
LPNGEVSDQPHSLDSGRSAESGSFDDSSAAAPRNISVDSLELNELDGFSESVKSTSGGEPLDLLDHHFESTFLRAGVGLAHVDLKGRFLRVNPQFTQILGYSSDELCQMTFVQISEPDSVARDLMGLQELLNGSRNSYTREKRYVRKDGSRVWCNVSVSVLHAPDPTCNCLVVALYDISIRKQAQEDLARANELLNISQAAGGTGSFEWIIPENKLTWSENHSRLFGLELSDFDCTFGFWRKQLEPSDATRIDAELRAAFAERREEWVSEHQIIRADTGEKRWLTSRARISYDLRGNPLLMVGVSIDTTDRKRAEQELQRSREDLEHHVHQRTAELVQKTLEMSEQARQLDQANENLRQLSSRILHLQDEERRRIASHLHDTTGGWITALAMNLSVVQSESAQLNPRTKIVLADSLEILRDMSNDLRTVSHLLHPPLLDEMGLRSALRWFVEEFSKRSNISVEIELAPNLGRLTRECETAIFRIVQEALTNVHRHSGSPRASICITRSKNELALEVRDWGKGLPALQNGSPRRSGVGLQGMQERVRQLGGHFEIRNNPDGGTSVLAKFDEASVCLPLAAD